MPVDRIRSGASTVGDRLGIGDQLHELAEEARDELQKEEHKVELQQDVVRRLVRL